MEGMGFGKYHRYPAHFAPNIVKKGFDLHIPNTTKIDPQILITDQTFQCAFLTLKFENLLEAGVIIYKHMLLYFILYE